MRRPKLQLRLGTLALVVLLTAVGLGYLRTWQTAAATTPKGPGYRIASAVLAGRDARPSSTVRIGVDPIVALGIAAVVGLAARRRRGPRQGTSNTTSANRNVQG